MIHVLDEADEEHDDGHPETGSDEHQLSSFSVSQASPHRRDDGGYEERRAERNRRPSDDVVRILYPELFDEQWEEWKDETHRRGGQEATDPNNH